MKANVTKVITKEAMQQYEKIRARGSYNMMDRSGVQAEADLYEYHALASLTKAEYLLILRHYSELMQHHGIERMG